LRAEPGGFEVEIPWEARYEYAEQMTLLGTVSQHAYAVRHPETRFDIERHDLPRLATFLLSAERILDRTRDSLLEEHRVALRSEDSISLQGYPGRRLFYLREGRPEETRLYLVGRHLYLAAAGPYPAELRERVVDRFFASFRICLDEIAPCAAPRSP
jgi:hypothetical protein